MADKDKCLYDHLLGEHTCMKDWLEGHGYDGLTDGSDCGCGKDDLAPCGEMNLGCYPAFVGPCLDGDHDEDYYTIKESCTQAKSVKAEMDAEEAGG